jgi:hypothetical protein
MDLLKRSYEMIQIDHRDFETFLHELRSHRAWEKVPIHDPYGSEERMLSGELGEDADRVRNKLASAKTSERVQQAALQTNRQVLIDRGYVAERHEGLQIVDPKSQKARAERNCVGVMTQIKLDALARHRPDLLEEVRSGRKSAHRAAVEAGIVRERTPFEKIARLIGRHCAELTPDERAQLKELLND